MWPSTHRIGCASHFTIQFCEAIILHHSQASTSEYKYKHIYVYNLYIFCKVPKLTVAGEQFAAGIGEWSRQSFAADSLKEFASSDKSSLGLGLEALQPTSTNGIQSSFHQCGDCPGCSSEEAMGGLLVQSGLQSSIWVSRGTLCDTAAAPQHARKATGPPKEVLLVKSL